MNAHSAEKDAGPRNVYENEDGICWATGCTEPADRVLVIRRKPDETFPGGLLIEAHYCWNDAIWFAGSAVVRGDSFVSLDTRVLPPGEGRA